ncbi:MAG: ABC transporter permease [Abitibacteriaceae bacterium]|nr:ABC transporter permease [Abditibacteriaceae bacterium]
MLLEINPILRREVRVRWRGPVAFGLVFGYAALLAALMGVAYASRVHYGTWYTAQGQAMSSPMAAVGHELFRDLTAMQMVAWMLLSPALTSASLAGEREHGMLELLQLSPLFPSRIAGGKLVSTLAFLFLMMLAPIPVIAMCFLMGGISPGEFIGAAVLQGVTALCCATIGLFCSAWCRRASTAMGVSFGIIILWTIGAFVKTEFLRFSPTISTSYWAETGSWLLEILARANPYYCVFHLDDTSWAGPWTIDVPAWQMSAILQLGLTALLFWSSTCALRKPLAEAGFAEPSKERKRPIPNEEENPQPPSPQPDKARKAAGGWIEPRFVARLHFRNPVLQRELVRKLRMRRPPFIVLLPLAILALVILYYYVDTFMRLDEPRMRGLVWWSVSALDMILIILLASAFGAVGLAREREAGTWEGLQLSLLSPHQIIFGKVLPSLFACWLSWVWLCPLLIPCISWLNWNTYEHREEVTLYRAVGTIFILASAAWCYTCWGLLLSWCFRRAWIAVGVTIATLIFALIMVPTFCFMSNNSNDSGIIGFLHWWHPLFGMIVLSENEWHWSERTSLFLETPLALFLLGWVWLFLLRRNMNNAIREKDTFRPER